MFLGNLLFWVPGLDFSRTLRDRWWFAAYAIETNTFETDLPHQLCGVDAMCLGLLVLRRVREAIKFEQ